MCGFLFETLVHGFQSNFRYAILNVICKTIIKMRPKSSEKVADFVTLHTNGERNEKMYREMNRKEKSETTTRSVKIFNNIINI